MKKRTTITTEKREVWIIISEDGPQSQIPNPASTDRAEGSTDTALITTEQVRTTTNEMDHPDKE